jgi:hypothetical protein
MGGFPLRANRTTLGPTYEDYKPVTDTKREIAADIYNTAFWQLAGLSQTAPLGWLLCTVSGGAVTTQEQALAWDPNGGLSALTWTYLNAGVYVFAFSSQYPDERGVNTNLVLRAGLPVPARTKGTTRAGTHTGANNAATLTDSTQSWTVNELQNDRIYNITDGSNANIVSNTADTVTATLGGGTDNDWDTGDLYIILENINALTGHLQLTTDTAGIVTFREGGIMTDPDAFLLMLF